MPASAGMTSIERCRVSSHLTSWSWSQSVGSLAQVAGCPSLRVGAAAAQSSFAAWRYCILRRRAEATRPMVHPRIQSDPKVMMGKPVIRGTRITVEHILRCLAAGDSIEQVLCDHPRLTADDIRTAQAFAADL